MQSSAPALYVDSLSAGYGPHIVIRDVSLSVLSGEVLGVIGANGSGKSTCAKAIMGLCRVRAGSVKISEEGSSPDRDLEFAGRQTHLIARLGLAYVPQVNHVFDDLTVRENLEMGAYTCPRKELPGRIEEVLELFPELGSTMKKKTGVMSGGQRGMVAVSRALMSRPRFMLMDEPTSGLAPAYKTAVWEYVARVAGSGVGLLVVEQDARRAVEHSDRCCVFAEGTIVQTFKSREIDSAEEVAGFYLGI